MSNLIKPTEHLFIAGRTGSGKTYMALSYLAQYDQVIILDTKGMITWPQVDPKELGIVTKLERLPQVKKPKVIYRPDWEELRPDYFEEFYRYCYWKKGVIVYTDELMSVCNNPQTYPPHLKAILTRGRERKTAAWCSTQRPSGIPALAISEATHFFIFDLNMPQDREKLASVSGCKQFEETPISKTEKPHCFWYWRADQTAGPKLGILAK